VIEISQPLASLLSMRAFFVTLVLAVPVVTGTFVGLRSTPVKPHGDDAEVEQLRAKLTKVSGGFSKLLSGSVGKTHVGSMMAKVEAEVEQVLKETAQPKDVKNALKRLQAANAAVKQLSVDMASEQTRLMHDGQEQEESLLLGILMQRQKQPMSKQLEVVNDPEFAKLPCVIATLAAKDTKTPLFKQIATYLDAHSPAPKQATAELPDKLKQGKDGKPDVTPIVLALEARLHKMEEGQQRMEEHHKKADAELDKAIEEKKNNTRLVHQIKNMKKHDDRDFAKQAAMAKHDAQALKSAIEAVKKGDMAGLQKAQNALAASMKAAQARSGKYLYLIQLMQRTEGQDCPFCVAQCVDKCHTAGKPYITCMTDCADAGIDK